MQKPILLACLAAALAAGCTANMNASVTPATPGASGATSAAPSAGASTTPAVSASAAVSVGASTTPGTATSAAPVAGNVDAAMAAMYKLGRKWTYEQTDESNNTKTVSTYTREVTKVEGGKAWVKTVTTPAQGSPVETTEEVDLTKKPDPIADVTTANDGKTAFTWTQTAMTTESITVKAGSYTATKYAGKLKGTSSGAGGAGATEQDATFWANDTVGLIKLEMKGSQSMSAGGMTMNITFSSTHELVSVTN